MKKLPLLLLCFTLLVTAVFFAQTPEVRKYERFDLFLTEQNDNLSKVKLGASQEEVVAIFGGAVRVQIPKVGKMKPLDKLFKQPEYKNIFKPGTPDEVVVLWYFTTPKDQNGYVSKSECTPIIFVSNKVMGIGWEAFNKARKDGTLR